MISDDHPSAWNPKELQLLNHVEVFLHKPAIMKKAEDRLNGFKDAMARELRDTPASWPMDTDIERGQIARGENNKGFPFLSLDIPQKFSKVEMFTLRTLFWWGHYLGYFLILKGDKQEQWLTNLLAARSTPLFEGVVMSTWATPWEWDEEQFMPVSSAPKEEITCLVNDHAYIKIGRVHSLSDPHFANLDWTAAGMDAWRVLSGITRP